MTLGASTSTNKSLKDIDELMSTLIDFSRYIMGGLKIKNLTREILLGPAFRLLKGTCSNYAELEYDFEECYKALSEKLDWENPEGGDYPFDISKPLPLITNGNRQRTKAAKYDLHGIEDMVPNIWSPVKVAYDRYALWVTHVKVMRKQGYGYLEEIVNQLTNLSGDDIADFAIALRMFTRSLVIQKHYQEYRYEVLADEKMEHIGKENSSFHDQGHQQAAKGKEDDEEFGEIRWW
ncbi:hypothetical protein Tco_1371693 [Tanacetum coccineum]